MQNGLDHDVDTSQVMGNGEEPSSDEEEPQYCPRRHALIPTRDPYPRRGYRGFRCDSCRNGVWGCDSYHCGECAYDLCPTCIRARKRLRDPRLTDPYLHDVVSPRPRAASISSGTTAGDGQERSDDLTLPLVLGGVGIAILAAVICAVLWHRRATPTTACCAPLKSSASSCSPIDHGDWTTLHKIGEGTHGSVYSCVNNRNGALFAAKATWCQEGNRKAEHEVANLKNEVRLLSRLEHKHIVMYLGSSIKESYFYMYLELISGGSLRDLLKGVNGPLNHALAANYGHQIVEGLAFLHSRDVIHRDLKPANVLMTTDGVLKLADFGTAFDLGALTSTGENRIQTFCGTPAFVSPEVVRRAEYTTASDVWSFGVMLFEMLTGRLPFQNKSLMSLLKEIGEGNSAPAWPPGMRIAPELKALVEDCLNRDASKRPSAESMLPILSTAAEKTEQSGAANGGEYPPFDSLSTQTGRSRFADQTLTIETEDSAAYNWTAPADSLDVSV